MKVAFLLHSFPKLSETFILNQIINLINCGVQVDIFAINRPMEDRLHPDVIKYNLLEKTYYYSIPDSRHQRIIKFVSGLLRVSKRCPLVMFKFASYFRTNKYLALNRFFYAEPFLVRDYHIVHCHFGTVGRQFCYLKDILGSKIKFLVTFHGFDLSLVLNKEGVKVYDELFFKADLFLPISSFWKNKLIKLGCPSDRIMVHRMGIDPDLFTFCPKRLDSSPVKLLTVARLVEKKGLEFAIKAIAKIKKVFPNIVYKIAGDGPLRNKLQELISQLFLEDTVLLLGPVDQDEVRKLMYDSHIFILPSVTSRNGDKEGIPVVLMEAQAMGLPVVSTWHSGIPELVVDGKSGFLVPERNVDALVDRLFYLLKHPEIWPEMGFYGRKIVEEKYNIKKLTKRLIQIYETLINSS